MLDFTFSLPTRILFGSGARSLLKQELGNHSITRTLLVYGRGSVHQNGCHQEITEILKTRRIPYVEHPNCGEDPDDRFVAAGTALALDCGADFVIGLGGGSAIDAAKAIALLAANKVPDIWEYRQRRAHFSVPALPLGVVLTTTGTGSEGNGGFVISRQLTDEKVAFTDLSTRPRFAYCNPNFTRTLPRAVLTDNHTDVLSHLLEQFFSTDETPGIVDAMILEAMDYLLRNAHALESWQDSYSTRANMMFASTISLSYLFSCGKKIPWILHHLAHALAAIRPISHGASLRIIIPGWLAWLASQPAYAVRSNDLCKKLSVVQPAQLAAFFVDHFSSLSSQLHPQLSRSEKSRMVETLCADEAFLSRAGLRKADLRSIVDWTPNDVKCSPA